MESVSRQVSYIKHPLYRVLSNMKQRCGNPKNKSYKNYGGRGISICDVWTNDSRSFIEWALANGWEHGLTIDRIDNNENYEPGNCRFVTRAIQSINKSNNCLVGYKNEPIPLSVLAEKEKITKCKTYSRWYRGYTVEEIINMPHYKRRRIHVLQSKKNRIIEYDGKQMTTREFAEEYAGCGRKTVTNRLNAGWTLAEIISAGRTRMRKTIQHEGTRMSVAAFARKYACSIHMVYKRMYQGWTPSQIIAYYS